MHNPFIPRATIESCSLHNYTGTGPCPICKQEDARIYYRKRFLKVCGYVLTIKHLDADKIADEIFGK